MSGSQGTLQRHMALIGTLSLSLPTISKEGPRQLMAVSWGTVHGESPELPTDAGAGGGFASGSLGRAGLGSAAGLAGSIQEAG